MELRRALQAYGVVDDLYRVGLERQVRAVIEVVLFLLLLTA